MTPREAASALVAAMPGAVTEATLDEYGIEPSPARAQALTRELLSLNLFWMQAAIDAHIPQKYQQAVIELVWQAIEAGWGTTYPVGPVSWNQFTMEWSQRRGRYERLVRDGASALAVSTEVGIWLEEQRLVDEEDRRNVLTLLIDSVPVETYGRLLEDVG